MKRKITGVCLALAVTLGMWCGAQTSIEFASAYAESEEVTDLEDILGDAESENTGETLGDNENGMGDNDTGEIIVDESEEDEADGTDIDLTESEDVEISDAESDSEEVSAIEFNTDETFSDGDEELEEDHQEAETADPEAMVARAASRVPVQWVEAGYKMRDEYAFTYAFRKNTTKLTSISRHNGTLNAKMHDWYGDERGFTENYCKTFYGCAIDDKDYTDPITAIYSNVGEYNGKIVDLKVTAVKWGAVNKNHVGKNGKKIIPCILFYKDKLALNTIAVGTVRFRFEFLDHATQNKISPKGHVTMKDLDAGQGIRVYDGWGVNHIYLRKGYNYLKKTTGSIANGSIYNEIASPEGIDAESDDVKAWCQLDFDGYFMVNWNSQENRKTATYPQNAYFSTTGKTVGTYEPNPGPEKKVGDDGMDYEQMSRHEYTQTDPPYEITEGKNFDYMISQRLLPGSYSAFTLQDTLDSCLQFQSASVTTASGKDVTDRFSIQNVQNTVTFTANTAFLKTDEAYNDVTYYFRIKVTAGNNDTIEAHGHYRKNENIYTIENKASRTIISDKMQDTQQTNSSWVKGEIPKEPTDGQITVTKRIREQDITWAHGNPVFRFSVRGTDTSDITHMYEDYVEFRKGEYLTDGEYAVISCTFTNLPMGKYTVSEKKTLRYVFESITAQTSNVSLNDRNGIAVLDRNNKVAAVTFTNKKTRYDRYSHTDVVRNQIHIQN